MLRLRLFRREDAANQIATRALQDGELSIGRDARADWPIDDPDRAISRRHLVVANKGGLVTVRDISSNGVFVGEARQRIERDRAVPIERGEPVHFGNYVLMLEEERGGLPEPAPDVASPFDDLPGVRGSDDRPRNAAKRAFDSAIKADPLAVPGAVGDEDAWDRRPDAAAGSWDAVAAHRKPEHTTLIGSDRDWAEPPARPAQEAGYGFDAPFARPILEEPAIAKEAAGIPSNWMDESPDPALPPAIPEAVPAPPREPSRIVEEESASPPATMSTRPSGSDADAVLFDHFCAGAGLSPAAFAEEDRAQVMERLGGVYRQAVLGIADLMRERTALRNEYRMVHTTVRPEGNNPFKWVPPQRIAVELLRGDGSGYTTGDRALNDALHDIKAHLLCMLAGMRAAMTMTFHELSPATIEARAANRNYLIKTQREAALWLDFVERAERLRAEADDSADGLINRAFRQAYEAQAAELNGR